MKIELRWYQQAAVDSLWGWMRANKGNPCIVIPTAGGKTPIIANICKTAIEKWDKRIVCLAHRKELIEQGASHLMRVDNKLDVGIYSAGMGMKQLRTQIVYAGIHSIYEEAAKLGRRELVLIDEAHLVPPEGEGMYRRFLRDIQEINPKCRIVGLTATPYRLKEGLIYGEDRLFADKCFEVGVTELMQQGYISRITSQVAEGNQSAKGVSVRQGEYVAADAENRFGNDKITPIVAAEIAEKAASRQSILVFCCTVRHADRMAHAIESQTGWPTRVIHGGTSPIERDATIRAFKERRIRCLVNVEVLTTGFDAPCIDCVALVRPTMSPSLYYQMAGRGFRLFEGKQDCLLLDFAGNIDRHGPVDELGKAKSKGAASRGNGEGDGDSESMQKECRACGAMVPLTCRECPECKFIFSFLEAKPTKNAATTLEITSTEEFCEVLGVEYSVHTKKGADESHPKTMRVTYTIDKPRPFKYGGGNQTVSEWVCAEHQGWARANAEKWWAKRCRIAMPSTAEDCVFIAREGYLSDVKSVLLKITEGVNYPELIEAVVDDPPDPSEVRRSEPAEAEEVYDAFEDELDEVPF